MKREDQSFDSLPIGIFVIDTDMNIVSFNACAERITGFSKAEAMACKCFEIFRAKQCFGACPLRAALEKKGANLRARNTILTRDNVEIPVEITASVMTDSEGQVTGALECFQEAFPENLADSGEDNDLPSENPFEYIIGNDPRIRKVVDICQVASKTDAQILITGETGTGKDVFARCIHQASLRREGRLIKVNCAAMPEDLLESELFGYKKGAFTDAKADKPGRFQLAEGGTIFLDEIGELGLGLQSKLLQVLDESTFYPLGASKPVIVDVRVVSSTNRDLERMVADGLFREDLYYRLKVINVVLPPLRDRSSDLHLFIDHFLNEKGHEHGLTARARELLLYHSYPGNIRELKHVVEHACIMSQEKPITPEMLPESVHGSLEVETRNEQATLQDDFQGIDSEERAQILKALRDNGWSRQKTAEALSINRTTLWRKMKQHGFLQ